MAKNVSYLLRPGETHCDSARRSRREDRRSSRPLLREQPRAKRAKIARFASRSLGDVNRLIGERVPATTKRTTDIWLKMFRTFCEGETHHESARRSRREDRRSSRPLLREQPRAKRAAVPKYVSLEGARFGDNCQIHLHL